jgi:uncharacterized phage protein gp47/JayE
MADVLATVWAGAVHMLHGHLEYVAEQLFADSAEEFYLTRIAAIYGLTPTPAAFATGSIDGTGTNGTAIPIATVFVRDDGATYEATAGTVIAGGVVSVPVQATLAGDDGNLATGETLDLESPIAGVDETFTVDGSGLGGGTDQESTEELRDRLLLRLQTPPAGGSAQDYEAWSLAVAGVTRAWVFRHEGGLGTVTVRFVRDNDATIFPDAGEVAAVQSALDLQRPLTAEVTAEAPVQLDVDFTIALSPDTAAIRTEVEASLTDLLLREAEPGDGAGGGTILLSQIRTAIGVAVGEGDYTLTVPAADVVPALGELPVIGTITWS